MSLKSEDPLYLSYSNTVYTSICFFVAIYNIIGIITIIIYICTTTNHKPTHILTEEKS